MLSTASALPTQPGHPGQAAQQPVAVPVTPEPRSAMDALVEVIVARREEFERLSHVPRDVIELFKRVGIYRAATPKRFGGDARAPAEFLEMIETIATADGSAA